MIRNIIKDENQFFYEKKLVLNKNIVNILFENKHSIKKIFNEIVGLYDIAHFAITIINDSNEIVSFSTKPDIEYNLINKNLWNDDCIFSSRINQVDSLLSWDKNLYNETFDERKKIKLYNNKFTYGMTIKRAIDDFCFLYSFATKNKRPDMSDYYLFHTSGLIDIGDFFYRSVRDIYKQYCEDYEPPKIGNLISKLSNNNKKSYLKLLVNNT
jgi:hypothetical protein